MPSAFCCSLAGYPNGSERPEQPRFWVDRGRAPDRSRYMAGPLCRATAEVSGVCRSSRPLVESFTGVIGRAGLDQGRGVLSRVTSASMLFNSVLQLSVNT